MRRCLAAAIGASLPALLAASVAPAIAQDARGTTRIAPSDRYHASGLHRWLLGEGYRDTWGTPVRVGILDLDGFAGGLTLSHRGGGRQTRTLHFEGPDGRRYVFRTVDKYVEQALPPDLQRTFVHDLFQDHMSALHPSGALAVPPLLEAVDVLHVEPRLVVMPDDARLGEHRDEFAGVLGLIEERPNEGEDGAPGFAGSRRVVATDRLLERLEEDARNRVDAGGYLVARLMDFVIGDTDRGSDQWRWAGFEQPDGSLLFRPVPRDRDWAFLRSEGPAARLARMVFPKLAEYGPGHSSLKGLVFSSIHLDRRLLAELSRERWEAAVSAIEAGLTDDIIEAAATALPPEHQPLEAERMAAGLRGRRDGLRDVAAGFYELLASEVDVRATDEADVAEIEVLPDGGLEVRLYEARRPIPVADRARTAPVPADREPFFQRRFLPAETREVRVYLLDGDDSAVVRGGPPTGGAVRVRIIGGPGADVLADSASAPGTWVVALHDDGEADRLLTGPRTRVDRRSFEPPEAPDDWFGRRVARSGFRDWGRSRSVRPVADYGEGAGVMAGARWSDTRYGFRRVPHAHRLWAEAMYGTRSGGFAAGAGVERPWENSAWSAALEARASQLDAFRFYGFGNDAPLVDPDAALVMQDRVALVSGLTARPAPGRSVGFGVRADYYRPRPPSSAPLVEASPFGRDAFGAAAVWADAVLDASSGDVGRRSGYAVEAGVTATPAVWDVGRGYGRAQGEARAYLGGGPVLAIRAGGQTAWGAFPVQDAAFIGGKTTLRGYRYQRLAGDAALYGGAELRAPLTRMLLILRGELGAFGFADAGRVFVDRGSPGGWHTGFGGGLWFTSLGMTVRGTVAHGEETRFYLDLGSPF